MEFPLGLDLTAIKLSTQLSFVPSADPCMICVLCQGPVHFSGYVLGKGPGERMMWKLDEWHSGWGLITDYSSIITVESMTHHDMPAFAPKDDQPM